jgi:protein tyrosine phosphatase (PTP) superfamily phosphohydrolase (DUF442 family)
VSAWLLRFLAIVLVAGSAFAVEPPPPGLRAPNIVAISPTLVTSGQPNAESLAKLGSQGFRAVIYLAPPTVHDAVPREAEILREQGIEFINIPIQFNNPTDADFTAFMEAMAKLRGEKVLVHCQVNMRASTFAFLYRVIGLKEQPEQAYEAVSRVWTPSGPWKRLMVAQLQKAGIKFDPY